MVHANVVSHNHQESGAPPNKRIIKNSSKLFYPKYQAQSSLGEENGNSFSLKRVHFVNTITIVKKEDELKKTEKESKVSKIIVEEGESSDIGNDNKTSDLEDQIYESLIEKMLSCSLYLDFRIEKGDPSNLKIPCMIWRKFIASAYIDLDLPMHGMSLAYYNTIRNKRVILSDDDFRRECESPLDLKNRFYKDINKLGPSYNKTIEILDLEGPMETEGSKTSEGVT
ncbi:hypothetical protein Tco_1158553 [Tanacetum coccineum]